MNQSASYLMHAQDADQSIKDGNAAQAIASLKQALKLNPNYYQGWLSLGRILHEQAHYSEAVMVTQAADKFDPLRAEFGNVQQALQARRLEDATTMAESMLVKIPGHPRALLSLSQVAHFHEDHAGRVARLQDALKTSPANIPLRMALFGAQEDNGSISDAIDTARRIADLAENFETVSKLVGILFRYGQNEETLEACDRAEKLSDGDPLRRAEINLVRAQVNRILGKRERSVELFRDVLKTKPNDGIAWWGLADMKTYEFSETERQTMQGVVGDPRNPADQKCPTAFALAKSSEQSGDWDATMAGYHSANALRPNRKFNPQRFSTAVTRVIETLDQSALQSQANPIPSGPTPIFILGLPRSGSTLVEQILASHSRIEGTVEQPILPNTKMKAHALCVKSYGGDYLTHLGAVSLSDLSELGTSYLNDGAFYRGENAPFFTDKLPFNFEHVGLIHKILPHAIIIDTRRNPLDCGFSLYKQYFSQGSEFSYALEDIGVYYNGYLRLMDHWHAVLPNKVLTVQYEQLVREPERFTRQILDHVGVPFEAACLSFYENERAVRTASSEQVRQPMNTKGIGAWRRVEAHLQPLKKALGEATLARFDGMYDA